jgi:hypothetical protein
MVKIIKSIWAWLNEVPAKGETLYLMDILLPGRKR